MRTLHITVSEFKIGVLLAYFVNWFVLHNISLMICSMDPCLVSSAGPNREDQIKRYQFWLLRRSRGNQRLWS